MRYRVTGLAAEGAFFALLSLPPLVFGLAGSVGYVVGGFGPDAIETVKRELVELARRALTEQSIQSVIVPTVDAVLERGRAEVISIGFVLALWSGSRALNVFIDTITIMYGMGGRRGIVRTRILSFTMYVIALGIGIVVIPLVLAGPTLVDALLPAHLDFLTMLYWPIVVVMLTGFLTTLYHLALPERTPWLHDLGGAVLAMLLWLLGSFVLRMVLTHTVGGTSIYGPLAAPIAVLLWLYVIVISLLVGAAFNATLHGHLEQRAERRTDAEREEAPAADELTGEGERDDPERTAEEGAAEEGPNPEADLPGSPPDRPAPTSKGPSSSEGIQPSEETLPHPEEREPKSEQPAVASQRGPGVRGYLHRPGRAEPPGPAGGRRGHPKAK